MKIEKVLVVDDSKVAHLTLRKMLTERGIDVDWVGSGEDSIVYLKDQKPDLVFMDVMMPGMDGFETTNTLNTDASIDAPPIVMCSANTTDEDKANAEKLGAVDFLSKPYTMEELDSVLNKVSDNMGGVATAVAEPMEAMAASSDVVVSKSEQQAWAATDKTTSNVSNISESAVREAAEAAARKAAQAATQAAKSIAEKSVQAAMGDVTRNVTEQVTAQVSDTITQEIAKQQPVAPDVGKIRKELQQNVDQQVAKGVEDALAKALDGAAFKQKLQSVQQAMQQDMMPQVEDIARRTANDVMAKAASDLAENDRSPAAMKLAGTALAVGVIALLGVLGIAALTLL